MKLIDSRKVREFNEKSKSVMNLYYSLISEKVNNKFVYGIKITSFINGIVDEIETVKGITSNRNEAIKIFKICVKNAVTPVSISYILDDFVSLKEM